MKDKILQILAKYSILKEAVGDIVIKDRKAMFTIDIALLELSKIEAEKIVKICESEIKKLPEIQKVTIILVAENSSKQRSEMFLGKNKNAEAQQNLQSSKQNQNSGQSNLQKNLLGQDILPVVGVKKIIAIASAKGGVGKSTIAANLAIALTKVGHKVALVDADIYGPSIPHLMNLTSKPEVVDNLIVPLVSHKVKCISVGSLIDNDAAGVWRGPMITKILYQLIRAVNWSADKQEVDVMIIDMPPGTGDVYLSLAEKFPLNGVVIVSTPQSLAIIDVVRSIDCFKKLKIPILGLIQNMSYLENNGTKQYIFGKDGAKNLAQKQNIEFLGECPIAQEICDATEKQIPFIVSNSSSELTMIIGRIAEKIIDKI